MALCVVTGMGDMDDDDYVAVAHDEDDEDDDDDKCRDPPRQGEDSEDGYDGDIHGGNNVHQGNDRKPAAAPPGDCGSDGQEEDQVEAGGDGDRRFLCSICLEVVSDEPVVTRCGHLYCWPCLYTWLEPGIDDDEYHAAFGGGGRDDRDDDDNAIGGGRRGGGGRQGRMAISGSLQQRREPRRRCPVCKAPCTVDSVVPIYVSCRVQS